jgi:CheY-like chemotaxis protein
VVSSLPPDGRLAVRARVLVVDDEPLVLRSLTRVLARCHDVVSANSVAEAEALLATDAAFDVVLCDLMMPDRTGIDFYEKLLTDAAELAERVVFLTGGAFTPRAAEFIESVPNRSVYKPLSPGEILELVQRVVRSKGMRSRPT